MAALVRRIWKWVTGVFLVLVGVVIWDPVLPYDPEKVDGSIRELEEPFRYAEAVMYMDGGSIAVDVEDALGVRKVFWCDYERNWAGRHYPIVRETLDWDKPPPSQPDPFSIYRTKPTSEWPPGMPNYGLLEFREENLGWDSKMRLCEILREHRNDWRENDRREKQLRRSVRVWFAEMRGSVRRYLQGR